MNWQEKFVKEFNETFGPPFLPEGFAQARIKQYSKPMQVIEISIGDRDTDFDESGGRQDSGTSVGSGVRWDIIGR